MNVGFRPRLKARPSLYDLVRTQHILQLSRGWSHSWSDELPPELPALPPLPPSPSASPPRTPAPAVPNQLELHPLPPKPAKMAPKKEAARDEDGEEQYGIWSRQQLRREGS